MRTDHRRATLATVPAAQPANPPTPACGTCKHWGRLAETDTRFAALTKRRGPVGECRESPPAVVLEPGPVLGYGLTDEACPACGRYQAKK